MLKYRIFFVGAQGSLWDAYKNYAIPNDLYYDTIDDAVCDLALMDRDGLINNKVEYVFLPVYQP